MELALFGISDGPLNLAVSLLVLFLVVVWLSLVYWTFMDARRRIDDRVLIACAIAASLFPFVGTVIYAILRPPEFLDDVRERAVETRAAQLRVKQLSEQACPNCEYPVERSYMRCPSCQARLKDPCPTCSQPLDPRWSMCPYCETPQEAGARRQPSEVPEALAAPEPPAEPTPERKARPQRRRRPEALRKAPARSASPKPARAAPRKPLPKPAKPASASKASESSGKRSAKPRPAARRSGVRRDGVGEDKTRPAPAS
jgi:hypothetical protein